MSTAEENKKSIWFLGYGSNMDADNLSKLKSVIVQQTTPAILRGYKLTFTIPGFDYTEPNFANCEASDPSDSIHGVAFETDQESIDRMDRIEIGYEKAWVPLEAYDGRRFEGHVYVRKTNLSQSAVCTPSRRYMQLIIKAAKRAGLDPAYIAKLEAVPTYQPSGETLARRASLVAGSYPVKSLTRESLDGDPSHYTSILGYIFYLGPPNGPFTLHYGREATSMMLLYYLNLGLDGKSDTREDACNFPSLKLIAEARPDALDYLWTWFDTFANKTNGVIVARHREFLAAQDIDPETGKPRTRWRFPVSSQ